MAGHVHQFCNLLKPVVAMAQPQQAMRLPPAVVTKVNEIMDSQKPINTQVDQILDVFLGHGFARKQTIKPCQVLTHPENRGKTMLNVHDCWHKGMQMLQVGMKRSLLGESICAELSTNSATRQKQMDKNVQMVAAANGSLAPVTGHECFWATQAIFFTKLNWDNLYTFFLLLFAKAP